MRKRSIQSNMVFIAPTDEQIDQEFTSSNPSQSIVIGEARDTTIFLNDSPKSPHVNALQPPSDEKHLTKFMFDDDIASVGALPLFSTFKTLEKPSFSKPDFEFGLPSSSSKHVEKKFRLMTNSKQLKEVKKEQILLKEIKHKIIPLLSNLKVIEVVMMINLRVPPWTLAHQMKILVIHLPSGTPRQCSNNSLQGRLS